MRKPLRTRVGRALAAAGLLLGTMLPPATTQAADNLVLKAGTDQKVETLNPWNSVTVVDYEVFTLNYDLLVNFGTNIEPVPGFAESWTQ